MDNKLEVKIVKGVRNRMETHTLLVFVGGKLVLSRSALSRGGAWSIYHSLIKRKAI
jgi:hypothetical protein